MNILVVVPARGGSKGIPRKNLRYLAGKPLLYYVAKLLGQSKFNMDVYLSSDDLEILNLGRKMGMKVHQRSSDIANDAVTLDPVVYDCMIKAESIENIRYDLVITMQPTSPLLLVDSLDAAIEKIINNPQIETVLSAVDTTALAWTIKNDEYVPLYEKRVNRQYLKPNYCETGGFFISQREVVTENNRIGAKVELHLLTENESIDIDTFQDWAICEYLLKKKRILFVLTGNSQVGLGHVYNSLLLANDILNHDIQFLVDRKSGLAAEVIERYNYKVSIQQSENIIDDIILLNPDVVINDCLDTSKEYIQNLKKNVSKVINFEDLGFGSEFADLVVNAIYPESNMLENHYFGANYFLLRDEFLLSNQKIINKDVSEILLTFGGVDPLNNTKHVLDAIYSYCLEHGIKIRIITGFGYRKLDTLVDYSQVEILEDVKNISDYMLAADIIFTSAGRTIYEVASLGVPCIVLAQNQREMTHYFASEENGFMNLGLGSVVSTPQIKESFINLVDNFELRLRNSNLMKKTNFINGRKLVVNLIKNEIDRI